MSDQDILFCLLGGVFLILIGYLAHPKVEMVEEKEEEKDNMLK